MYIIEVSCPLDRNAVQMRNEKIAKYNPLVHELSRIHKKPVSLVPIVIGCTGVVADGVAADLASLPVEINKDHSGEMQYGAQEQIECGVDVT